MRIVNTPLNSPQLFEEFKAEPGYKTLNTKQKEFFKHLFKGENIFLTGAGGTGKSHCVKLFFEFAQKKGIFIGRAALTGVAAINIGGVTIHSWGGLGLADEDVSSIIRKAFRNKPAVNRIQGSGVVFIDEISMASAELLEKIDKVFKAVRYSPKPFGGLQVVCSGDFLQLPPVQKGYGKKIEFAFQSSSWDEGNFKIIELTKLVRQDENSEFAKLLQKIRFGYNEDLSLLVSRVGAKLDTDLEPVKIFCKNINIDRYNLEKYNNIQEQEVIFYAKDTGESKCSEFFDKNCPAPKILKLKKGTQVMLLVNLDVQGGLVNGSIGVVEGFSSLGPIVRFSNGEKTVVDSNKWEFKEQSQDLAGQMRYRTIANRSQIPLKLAWALSVHKTQGATLDFAHLDLSDAFEYGQGYVGISRARTLEGLSLTDFSPDRIKAHPDCVKFYRDAAKKKKE